MDLFSSEKVINILPFDGITNNHGIILSKSDADFYFKTLLEPYSWRKPRIVLVNSMSDLFHKEVSTNYIKDVFKVMNDTPQHTYQVLTKRAERLLELSKDLTWTKNCMSSN